MNWDEYYMRGVYWTLIKSKEKHTKIGTIITKNNRLVSQGYNGIPIGVEDTDKRLERPEKYYWISHSERNAIYSAAYLGHSTAGTTMYSNALSCVDCAKAIIQANVVRVCIHKQFQDFCELSDRKQWEKHDSITTQMFKESGVELIVFNKVLGINTLFNGKVVQV